MFVFFPAACMGKGSGRRAPTECVKYRIHLAMPRPEQHNWESGGWGGGKREKKSERKGGLTRKKGGGKGEALLLAWRQADVHVA